jgi:hypothetical protein
MQERNKIIIIFLIIALGKQPAFVPLANRDMTFLLTDPWNSL